MKAAIRAFIFTLFALHFLLSMGYADNPVVQTNYTADPAPMVYKDRVYLITSHDEDKTEEDFYTMRNYCGFSSSDMVNWTHHGIVASLKDFKWITVNNGAWAPQCVERNGKFYLYIPIQGKGVGVLTSDSPMGPFTDPIGKPLWDRGNWSDIDPTVYIDRDGQAYLYWGNGTLWYVKLHEDMTSYSGGIVTANPKPSNYTEGPWLYRRGDHYYMWYAGMGGSNENLQYAMSSSATGPWTNKGTIMQSGNCFTNHPGICDFNDNSYLFYHNANLPGGGTFKRSVCIEQFTYNNDGTIPTIKQTSEGPAQVGSLNPYDTVQAETICFEKGIKTETCSEGTMQVSQIENGDYLKVKGVDFGDGAKSFDARVASGSGGGKIELHLDSEGGTLIGTCEVKGTGGWDAWETVTGDVSDASGKRDLYLKFTGGSGTLFSFNWWKFAPVGTAVSGGKKSEYVKRVTMVVTNGAVPLLRLDFSQQVLPRTVMVCLFDLTGRLVATPFTGQATSNHLSFPINGERARSGAYIARVSFDNKTVLTDIVSFK